MEGQRIHFYSMCANSYHILLRKALNYFVFATDDSHGI